MFSRLRFSDIVIYYIIETRKKNIYEVVIGRHVRKNLRKLPPDVVSLFHALVIDLTESGPVQP